MRKWLMGVKGSTTVEMAYLMPLIFLVLVMVLNITFYYHDKNILNGAACETIAVGIQSNRNPIGAEADLEGFCRDRIRRKLIYFSMPDIDISSSEDFVKVKIAVRRGKMQICVFHQSEVPHPEKKIRLKKKMENTGK